MNFEYNHEDFGRGGAALHTFGIDQCEQDAEILDGVFVRKESVSEPAIWSNSYSVSGLSMQLEFAGKVEQFFGYRGSPNEWYWTAEAIQLQIDEGHGEFIVNDAYTEYLAYPSLPSYGEASMLDSVSLRSALTANR